MSIPDGNTTCIQCKLTKENTLYPYCKSRLTSKGYYTKNNQTCKKCISHNNKVVNELRKKHIKPDVGTPCENCNRPIIKSSDFQLDHDHKLNIFRGWLCRKCNTGLGLLGDDIKGLERALEYLRGTKKTISNTQRIHNEYMELVKENALEKYVKYGLKSVFLDQTDYDMVDRNNKHYDC